MSFMKRLGGRLPDFEEVVRRFPVPVVVMAAFTIWMVANNHFNFMSYRNVEYIASGFIMAGYVSVIAKLIVEARQASNLFGALIGLTLAVIAFLLCYWSRHIDFTAAMAIGAAILFLGNAAAWRSGRNDRNVWNFTQKLWTGALFATVGSIIFALGMIAISEAIKALFGFDIDELTFETILPIGLAFLAPVYWLGTLPRYGEAEDVTELSFEARALSFLGTWMLAPLVIIYALIVLAYGAKVLVQWDLPKGEIAQLVTPFIGVGMLVWLMLEPKVLKESGFVRFYRAAWHWIMLLAALLLGVAVFVRIREYGYTPERFFLALVVTWAVVQSLWFIIMPKVKRDIRIPTVLAAALLAFGAFAAQPISTLNQFHRAQELKRELQDLSGKEFEKNPELAKQFLGSLEYLVREEDEVRFKRLLPDRDMPETTYGEDFNALIETLGLDEVENDDARRWSNYTIASAHPVNLEKGGKLYVAPNINLYSSREEIPAGRILTSQSGFDLTFLIENETYKIDLKDIFSDVVFVGRNADDVRTLIPTIEILSENGIKAEMLIISGRLNFNRDDLEGGTLTIGFIVPN